MKPYSVEFVASERITDWIPLFDAYKFKPNGYFQWLQKLAWRFLHWRKSLEQAFEPKVTVTRHLIDADKFMERLFKQKRALIDGFHNEGHRLLIGSEDYADLMCSPEMTMHHFSFDAEFGYGRQILGLRVEVVPWMRGMLVMP